MIGVFRARVADSARALASVFRNPALRRIELARPAAGLAVSASNVVFLVIAFQSGGAGAVGALLVARTLMIAIAAPAGAVFGDRFARQRVIAAADLTRAGALVASAALVSGESSLPLILVFATVVGIVGTASSPARGALIPVVSRTPEELTAANVVASTSDNLMSFVAPAVGGVALALGGPVAGFVISATASAFSGLAMIGMDVREGVGAETSRAGRASRFALGGFRQLFVDGPTRLVMAIYSTQMFVGGILAVIVVIAAADLVGSQSGVGFLYSALGVGGFVGATLALALPDRALGHAFSFALMVWAAPIALIGAWPVLIPTLLLLALSGAADALVDVAGLTLLQRRIPNELLARVGGASATVMLAAATLGNVAAPFLVGTVGVRWSFVVAGALVPAFAPLWWRPVSRLDAVAPPALPAIRAVPIFAALPPSMLEALARSAVRVELEAGETVFRQGEPGDDFFVVVDGEVEFSIDGGVVGTGSRGDHFGEIALLRDEPRSATVTVLEDAYLFALARDDFLAAVRGEGAVLAAADELAATRLARARPAGQLA